MARTKDAPSDSALSPFYCEAATIMDVNRRNWTCRVTTKYSSKTFNDVPWSSPYMHYTGGEGFHYMPEIGAPCLLASPVDNSGQFILAFVSPPAVQNAKGDAPLRSSAEPGGSTTDVSFQGNRPDLNPGDLGLTGRDGNFIFLRRGGIVQIGSTPMAQRVVIPVRNFVHDFCENYEMATPGGDVTWLIDRPELDPSGQQPVSWAFHMQEFATDKRATVRVRHLPAADAGQKKSAWEVTIAPNGIDRGNGKVASVTYSMLVRIDGTQAEFVGASRSIEVKGDDNLKVGGDQTVVVTGKHDLKAKSVTIEATNTAALVGKTVKLADLVATEPGLLGNQMLKWIMTAKIQTPSGPGKFDPTAVQAFQQVLSKAVFLK